MMARLTAIPRALRAAQRQTPNAKVQTSKFAEAAHKSAVWRLAFEVWRLALSPPQALLESQKAP